MRRFFYYSFRSELTLVFKNLAISKRVAMFGWLSFVHQRDTVPALTFR